jgi:Flp pilus assembly protein TadG
MNGRRKGKLMSLRAGAHGRPAAWRDRLGRLIGDRRGVAAIEFALIVPLLLSMYFVTMEVSQAIESNKKVSRAGSMVADLVTQQQTIRKADLDAIMAIGESLLQPYNRSKPAITITAIEVTDEPSPQVKVVWSRKLHDGAFTQGAAKGSITTVPPALNTKGSFLVRAESALEYKPVITWAASSEQALGLTAAFANISMKETYYLRPRMSQRIACDDC